MDGMKRIDPQTIQDNPIKLISRDWMLITGGTPEDFNMMTASWGGLGFLWGRPVAFVFVRPPRHTFKYLEKRGQFTLSFFPEQYRKALVFCGKHSGRDTDKVAGSGLTPVPTEAGNVTFREARLVLECRTLYGNLVDKSRLLEQTVIPDWYDDGSTHKLYIAEITGAWVEE